MGHVRSKQKVKHQQIEDKEVIDVGQKASARKARADPAEQGHGRQHDHESATEQPLQMLHAAGDTHVLRGTMKRLEELLDPEKFVRIHRSTIVNRLRVRSLRPHRNGEYFLTLDNSRELKLSRKYKSNVERLVS